MNALVISTAGPAPRAASFRQASTVSATTVSAAAGSAASGSLRLTRRGRMLLLGGPALAVTAVLVFSLLAVLLGALASPANAAVKNSPVDMSDYALPVTVLQGDSLWKIAAASDPTRDVRDVVAEIVALNELDTGVVQAGQRLYVPIPR